MSFLPDGYEVPDKESGYMRFEQGKNRFRIISKAIVGNEYWITDDDGNRKPVRKRLDEKINVGDLGVDKYGEPERIRHFWAFLVWNYKVEQVQILEITQRTIQDAIKSFADDDEWGSPFKYDITVSRVGEELDTKYTVTPSPKSDLDDNVKKACKVMAEKINLEALFDGEDPFADASVSDEDLYDISPEDVGV